MKRLLAVVAIMLLSVTFLGADLFARQTPWERPSESDPIGEDHPWGGEIGDGDGSNSQTTTVGSDDRDIGSIAFDWIVSRLVFRYFDFNITTADQGHYRLHDLSNGQNDQNSTVTDDASTGRN